MRCDVIENVDNDQSVVESPSETDPSREKLSAKTDIEDLSYARTLIVIRSHNGSTHRSKLMLPIFGPNKRDRLCPRTVNALNPMHIVQNSPHTG
jgi:hypothetical protein